MERETVERLGPIRPELIEYLKGQIEAPRYRTDQPEGDNSIGRLAYWSGQLDIIDRLEKLATLAARLRKNGGSS